MSTNLVTEISKEAILQNLLNQLVFLTQASTDFDILTVLPAYCKEKDFKDEYDGLFWHNEGATWQHKDDIDVVKLVDMYFVTYRQMHYPEMKHLNISQYIGDDKWKRLEFPCRYDYLKSKEAEDSAEASKN